jgi:hypothetical protein
MRKAEELKSLESGDPAQSGLLAVIVATLLAACFVARQLSSWPVWLRYQREVPSIEGMRQPETGHVRQGIPICNRGWAEHSEPASCGVPDRFFARIPGWACSVQHEDCQ